MKQCKAKNTMRMQNGKQKNGRNPLPPKKNEREQRVQAKETTTSIGEYIRSHHITNIVQQQITLNLSPIAWHVLLTYPNTPAHIQINLHVCMQKCSYFVAYSNYLNSLTIFAIEPFLVIKAVRRPWPSVKLNSISGSTLAKSTASHEALTAKFGHELI